MIFLRKVEWKGDWSDSSSLWTPELKKLCKVQKSDDGVFWISIEDFVKYFQGIGVARVHETYFYNSINIDLRSKNYEIVRLNIEKETHVYFSVNQIDVRTFIHKKEGYVYSYARILLGKITDKGLVYHGGRYGQDRDLSLEVKLEPANYILLVEMDWMQSFERNITLSKTKICLRKFIILLKLP